MLDAQNIILLTDSYKQTHHNMYSTDSEYVYSYGEARKGAKYKSTVFIGLTPILMKYLVGPVLTKEAIDEAELISAAHFGNPDLFKRERWDSMLEKHEGCLPICIKAVEEGSDVPIDNVLFTIENTDPEFPWLTNALESLILHVWYPSTVATLSKDVKKTILKYLEKNGTPESIDFKLHDFGFRGATCAEAAEMAGMAHLVNFKGTDTICALPAAMRYYGAEINDIGFSVPATEHSIMTAFGRSGERAVYQNLLEQYKTGFLSVVADSYDIYKQVQSIVCEEFRNEILQRDGVFVVRPDSGDPIFVISKLLVILAKAFGIKYNDKGYQVLNPKIRLLWGDGIDPAGIDAILASMDQFRWSSDNITFGMGGGLHQKNIDRDTQRWAVKCAAARRGGKWYDIQKDPIDSSKKSKTGRLALTKVIVNGEPTFITRLEKNVAPEENFLQTIFLNGELINPPSWGKIRINAA